MLYRVHLTINEVRTHNFTLLLWLFIVCRYMYNLLYYKHLLLLFVFVFFMIILYSIIVLFSIIYFSFCCTCIKKSLKILKG